VSVRARRAAWSWLSLLWGLVVALTLASPADAADISVMRVERTSEGLVVSAQMQFDLPASVDEALQKGIPLFFVAEAALVRERWYWYDKDVARATRHLRLSYQPLTRRWRLLVSSGPIGNTGAALGQTFDTRDEALNAVQRISHWKIAEPQDVEPDARQSVTLRFRLDVSQLPRPFQIGLVGQDDWTIVATRSLRLGAVEAAK
jgi:hypothetical protein